jgi:hypothetical protein
MKHRWSTDGNLVGHDCRGDVWLPWLCGGVVLPAIGAVGAGHNRTAKMRKDFCACWHDLPNRHSYHTIRQNNASIVRDFVAILGNGSMNVKVIHDEGQTLPSPSGKVLGVIETRAAFDDVAKHLMDAGFKQVEVLHGDDGVALLDRVQGFFFSDMEERVLSRFIDELKADHAIIAIKVPSDRVNEAAGIAAAHGARLLIHFSFAAVTVLTK